MKGTSIRICYQLNFVRSLPEYKGIVQKATLTDEDFARASELETYLDEVPDYLALDFSEEYSRLKLELMNRE